MTPEQFKKLAPKANPELCKIFNDLVELYRMPAGAIPEFLANLLHESGGLTRFEENLNYSAEGLVKTWPSRFSLTPVPGKNLAANFARQPIKIANEVYKNRMGNTQPNDGYFFRGSGAIQITGRDAFTKYSAYCQPRDLTSFPLPDLADKIRTNNFYRMDSAFWVFCIFKDLEGLAVKDEMALVVKRINGGTIGMDDRLEKLKLVESVLG